jgi:hypothetical protein
MGIDDFIPYIKKVYGKACSNVFDVSYDNLYIDFNHVLHHTCYVAENTDDLMDRTREYLRGIIKKVKPKKRIIIASDGAAPLAKMLLQRQRRLNSIKMIDGDINLDKKLNLHLTSGTSFMNGLEKELLGFIDYLKETYKVEVMMFITDPDEGEIKIKRQLLKLQKKFPNETHIIYSLDSDVILILFSCDDLTKIYQMLNKDLILHFGAMYDEHVKRFGKTENTKNDFVIINLLMGNDYIPKVSFVKLENLWEAYEQVAKRRPRGLIVFNDSLQNGKPGVSIDPIFFHDILYIASKKSPKHMIDRFKITDLKSSHYDDYLKGLYWCFGMYVTGNCSDKRYIYERTNPSPHVSGVMMAVIHNNDYTSTTTEAIDVDLYGIFLIPEKANSLLSKEQIMIAEKLVETHPIIYQESRCDKCKKFNRELSKLNEECKKYENDTKEKKEVSIKIGRVSDKLSKHRETHENLTINKIEEISKDFIKIRDELRETMSLHSDTDNENENNENNKHKKYVPMSIQWSKLSKKRLF